METWSCVRSVVTDGSGHAIVDTDVMPTQQLGKIITNLSHMYNQPVRPFRIANGQYVRWTFARVLSDGRRVTDMIIASKIED